MASFRWRARGRERSQVGPTTRCPKRRGNAAIRLMVGVGFGLAILAIAATPAVAQRRRGLAIGYVYPAGGQRGSSFEAVVGGQFLTGAERIDVSGSGVQAEITELVQPITGKELNDLRIEIDELLARRAVVKQDPLALEQFRSFRNAKSAPGAEPPRDDLAELKKKYAGATWTDADETRLRQMRQKLSSSVRRPANPAIGELAILRVRVADDAPLGPRELRIATPRSLSNPLTFQIGALPEFSAKPVTSISERASDVAKTAAAPKQRRAAELPVAVAIPAVINGQMLPGRVDRYRFTATQGQRLVVAAAARSLIPYIADAVPGWFQATLAVYDDQGTELAYADDFRFDPDPVLSCQIPADGQYVVEIKDAIYRGREDFVYRITVSPLPFVTSVFPLGGPAGDRVDVELRGWNLPVRRLTVDNHDQTPGIRMLSLGDQDWQAEPVPFAVGELPECLEAEPNDQPSQTQAVKLPIIVNGRIGEPDDVDMFCFEGKAGDEIVAEVVARRLNSPLDSILKLVDAQGGTVAMNDDHEDKGAGLITHQADSWLRATLAADGVYCLHLGDMQHRGGPEYSYRLRIGPPQPDFELRVTPATISVQTGASAKLTVYALRRDGFDGEIALRLRDAPRGFSLEGASIPADQDQIELTLVAPRAPLSEPINLNLEGHATIDRREVVRPVAPAENMMQAFAIHHLVPSQELRVLVTGRDLSRRVATLLTAGPARIPAGGTTKIRLGPVPDVNLSRVGLRLAGPPEGIRIKDITRVGDNVEVLLESDAAKVRAGQKGNLILIPARKPPADRGPAKQKIARAFMLPAVSYEIVDP